jgi:hypothetical protein
VQRQRLLVQDDGIVRSARRQAFQQPCSLPGPSGFPQAAGLRETRRDVGAGTGEKDDRQEREERPQAGSFRAAVVHARHRMKTPEVPTLGFMSVGFSNGGSDF